MRVFKRLSNWMVAASLFMLVAGCGQSPLVSDQAERASKQTVLERVEKTFSIEESKKETPTEKPSESKGGNAASQVIGPDGGSLMLAEKSSADEDRLEIWFFVKAGALSSDHEITMSYDGQSLSSLNIHFQPKGLQFNVDARLQVKIGEKRVDLNLKQLRVLHHSANGTEVVPHEIDFVQGGAIIDVAVPGFSRYSFDD